MSNQKPNSSQKIRLGQTGVDEYNYQPVKEHAVLLRDVSKTGFGGELSSAEVTKNLVSLFNGSVLTDREESIVDDFRGESTTNANLLHNVVLSYIRPSSWWNLVKIPNVLSILRNASDSQIKQLNENVLASLPFIDVAVKVGVLMGEAGVGSRVLISTLIYEKYPVPLESRGLLVERLEELVDRAVAETISEI